MNIKIKVTAMALAVSILALTNTLASEETEHTKYANAIEFVSANGIMEGDENGDLRLDDTITRAEFVKMLITAASGEEMNERLVGDDYTQYAFDDVAEDYWAWEFIAKAKALGFVDGVDNTHFCPEDSVTYAQAIKIVLMACGINSYNVSYPYGYISAAIDSGMLTGIDIKPDEPITRRDAAKLMYNASTAVSSGLLSFEQRDILYDAVDSSKGIAGYGLFSKEVTITPVYGGSPASPAGSVSGSSSASAPMQSAGGSGGGTASVSESAVNSYGMAVIPERKYFSGEEYENYEPNEFRKTKLSPLSTFSIDTDTASYSNMRRFISLGQKPQDGSIRTEELINYFEYDTPEMAEDAPFGVTAQLTDCPWSGNKLARVTIAGAEAQTDKPSNLVFLIDVSGSMSSYNKLPMLKQALEMLVDNLGENDTVSIVTYASGTRVVLDAVSGSEKEKLRSAIEELMSGGGTNGADGLALAYGEIEKDFIDGGNNRIILCSDGDFNIGPSSTEELKQLITEKRKAGIYLTTMGFGMGNYKDNRMELLADYGNGSYYYIDTLGEAKRVFADKLNKTLYTVAEDVKIQVEFNPAVVSEYRLVGYENRELAAEDFENDTVDAGELGAGAKVTAVYELVMNGDGMAEGDDTTYRYQTNQYKGTDEAFDVKIRYKEPGGMESILKEFPAANELSAADEDTRFAAAAAMLGLKLNGVIDISYDAVIEQALSALSFEGTYDSDTADRWELVQLVELLKYIDR
ncbi:MAG: von Willebrand factor type A domain-containing protein [Candidatus Ornithomonoglobus sp.]